jgi:hypothetical protein
MTDVRHTVGVQDAFAYVMFGVVIVGVIVAVITFLMSGKAYEDIGKGGLFDDPDVMRKSGGGGMMERDDDIREMLEARNRRRVAAGRETVDVEAELQRLTSTPQLDPTLMAEIREHVEQRNARRIRRGHPPLDVEAEIARQLREFG